MSDPRERREERRFGSKTAVKKGPSELSEKWKKELKKISESGQKTKKTTRPQETETRERRTKKTRDLMGDIKKLKSDVNKLQQKSFDTSLTQSDIRNQIKELNRLNAYLRKGKVDDQKIEETKEKIEKIKEEIEHPPRGSWYGERPTIDFHKLTQTLYEKSNYPSKAEITKALEEKGLAAKEDFKPKSVGEALTRLAYATAEMIEGGVTEATLGLAYDPKSKDRPLAVPLQITGGIATPTALDYAFGAVIAKLGLTGKGRRLIKKIGSLVDKGDDIPSGLTPDELRQWEKMCGESGISTSYLRTVKGKKTLKTIQEVAEYYSKHPAEFTAGASYVPPEQLFYDEIIDDLGWDADEYIDFLKTYGDRLNIDSNVLAGVLLRVSIEDATKVLDSTAVKIPEDYKDRPDKYRLIETPKLKPGETPSETPEETPKETPDETPVPTPPPPVTVTETPPTSEPDEDEPTPGGPPRTPKPRLSAKDQKEMNKIRLKLYHGPVEKYEARFKYKRGPDQTLTIEARSFVEAMNKAQRARKLTRQHPATVELIKRS